MDVRYCCQTCCAISKAEELVERVLGPEESLGVDAAAVVVVVAVVDGDDDAAGEAAAVERLDGIVLYFFLSVSFWWINQFL